MTAKNLFHIVLGILLAASVLFGTVTFATAQEYDSDWGGGYADVYDSDWGGGYADVYDSDWGGGYADVYDTDWGGGYADIYDTDWGGGYADITDIDGDGYADIYDDQNGGYADITDGRDGGYADIYDGSNTGSYNPSCGCYSGGGEYGGGYSSGPGYSLGSGIGAHSAQLAHSSGGAYGSGGYGGHPQTGGPNYKFPNYAIPPMNSGGGYNSYTNTNITNTNTNITNVDNSINGSFNNYNSNNVSVAPIQYAAPQYPVAYSNPAPYYGNNSYSNNPYVALSQIPYTGFDYGTFGNVMYWITLAAFALGAGYLAIYYVPALAFANARTKTYAPVVAPVAPILVEKMSKAGTTDTMAIVQSKDGSMPKIVIARY